MNYGKANNDKLLGEKHIILKNHPPRFAYHPLSNECILP